MELPPQMDRMSGKYEKQNYREEPPPRYRPTPNKPHTDHSDFEYNSLRSEVEAWLQKVLQTLFTHLTWLYHERKMLGHLSGYSD